MRRTGFNRLLLIPRRFISERSKYIFVSETESIPVAGITQILNTAYTNEFKKIYGKLNDVELGENFIYIQRSDRWHHWYTEKKHPELYNEIVKFLKNGYQNQFSHVDEEKPTEQKVIASDVSNANQIRYEPFKYRKD